MIKIILTKEQQKELGTEYDTIEVKVGYWIGGYRGFDWVNVPRGYELDITPCTYIHRKREDGSEYTIRQTSINLGSGAKLKGGFIFLESTARKSAKRMQQLEESIDIEKLKKHIFNGTVGSMNKKEVITNLK